MESVQTYNFHKISALVLNFLTNVASSLYYTSIKDRLYCDSAHSTQRQSAQFVLLNMLTIVLQTVAPIVPHLAEEIYSYLPQKTSSSFFKTSPIIPDPQWRNNEISDLMDVILNIKKDINREYGASTLGISVDVTFSKICFDLLLVSAAS